MQSSFRQAPLQCEHYRVFCFNFNFANVFETFIFFFVFPALLVFTIKFNLLLTFTYSKENKQAAGEGLLGRGLCSDPCGVFPQCVCVCVCCFFPSLKNKIITLMNVFFSLSLSLQISPELERMQHLARYAY